MKTIKEHLETADRKRLLDCLVWRFISDPLRLLELKEYPVQTIMERYGRHMESFIERLLALDTIPSDNHVFYLYSDYEKHDAMDLVKLADIAGDIEAPGLDFTFTEWSKTLGYRVADTKLTQDNLTELLAQYLESASFFGTEQETKNTRIAEVERDLEAGIESMRESKGRPAQEAFDDIGREHGFPVPEEDDRQVELCRSALAAIHNYGMYGRIRERKRILATSGG